MEAAEATNLSRRERQLMDAVYRLGSASAAEIRENIPTPPSYSAVRASLAILVDKGYLRHELEKRKYIYRPTVNPNRAKRSALKQLLSTFYENSAENLVAALLDPKELKLSEKEIERIRGLIAEEEENG